MKLSTILIVLASINLIACQQETDSPRQVTEKYWRALKNGDSETARQLVSNTSQHDFDQEMARPENIKIPLNEISVGTEQMTVTTIITSNGQHIAFDTVLIQENGDWKIDVSRTQIPVVQAGEPQTEAPLPDALQENLDSMNEALEEGADMLNEFMHEGSKEMSESLLKGMEKMNESLREAMDKMKERREQQESEQAPADQNNNGNGEGLI